jgi:Ring finger domain
MPRCSKQTSRGLRCHNKCCNNLNVCVSHAPDCSICLEPLYRGETCTLVCGHAYHTTCIYPWFEQDHRCPYCRTSVRRPKVRLVFDTGVDRTRVTFEWLFAVLTNLYEQGHALNNLLYVTMVHSEVTITDLHTYDTIGVIQLNN